MKDVLPYASVLIAVIAAFVAYFTYRISTRRHLTESLLRIVDRLERPENRALRRLLYSLQRSEHQAWSEEIRDKIRTWGAELDIIALIVSSKEIDSRAFFYLYGDVVIRSIYLLAPYVNAERQVCGRQFMQPLGLLMPILIRQWRRESRRRNYPDEIGLPHSSSRLSLPAFEDDEACRRLRLETRGARRFFARLRLS